jgi:hypothetical protein
MRSHLRVRQAKYIYRTADWLHYPKQVQDDQYDCNDDQNMDPTTGFWEARTDPPTEEAKQPKDEQYYNDCPQHKISPFE